MEQIVKYSNLSWGYRFFFIFTLFTFFVTNSSIAEIDQSTQKKIDEILAASQKLAASEEIVSAVEAHNLQLPEEYKHLDNTNWKKLSPQDLLVKKLSQNRAAEALSKWAIPAVAEIFVSGKDGKKVAFLNKTTSWNHTGKAKHDVPMAGKIWKGILELDESTGLNQVQISVPVIRNGMPIGSLVVGIAVARL